MSKINHILNIMGKCEYIELQHPILNNRILIKCGICEIKKEVSAKAVYRQYLRGGRIYKCKSCAGKLGWNAAKKKEASKRTKNNWQDPNYSGNITGKAIINRIRKLTDIDIS